MKRLIKAFLYSCTFALISLLSVAFFWKFPLMTAGMLAIVSVLMLLIRKSREDILLYAICGVSGALAEYTAIALGAWTYAFPNIAGIPYWLPFLWGIAALFVKNMSTEIHSFIKK
ncbi:MAG: hypothetical protein WA139_02230 [Candidatus Aenigmatarchaeota archaeon]